MNVELCWTYARSNRSAECKKLQAVPFLVQHPGPSMQKPLVVMIKVQICTTARYKSSFKNDQLCEQSTIQNQRQSRALYIRTFVQHRAAQHRTHILLLNLHFKAWSRDRRDFERRQLGGSETSLSRFEQDTCHCFVVHLKSMWWIVSAWGSWGARKKNVLTCHGGCKGRLRQSFHLDIVYQHSWPGLELA